MTDRTHPDSGRAIGGIVEALRARIADLEAQLEAIGAGGVSGPLIGQPQAMPDLSQLTERGAKAWAGVDAQGLREGFTAADMATASAQGFRDGVASVIAGSEPVAEIGSAAGDCAAFGERALYPLVDIDRFDYGTMLYAHPSPPDGVAGWQPIETAPRDGTELLLYAPACVYEGAPVEARITYGNWLAPSDTPQIKYQDGFAPDLEWDEFDAHWVSWDGGFTPEHSPTHWMPLPPGPADGESNG